MRESVFKQIIEHYGLRPIALVGGAGMGKTTGAKKLSNLLNVKAYMLDNPLFTYISQTHNVSVEDLFNFYMNYITRDEKTYIECLEGFQPLTAGILANLK